MSTVRRRSRDPKSVAEVEENLAPTTHRRNIKTTTTATIFAILSTILITLYLISPWTAAARSPVPYFSGAQEADGRSKLHPEQHVHRDASTFEHHWRVTSDLRRPDGVLKRVYLVNAHLPGPTLEVRSGDRLIIHVENGLDNGEGISIHWHGLSMRGFNHMDGAAGVTQDPIASGESFTYDFVVDENQHGTFWWHAHDGVQRADGLYGGLVVHQPMSRNSTIDDLHLNEEHLLMIGDWYHRSGEEALQFYMHPGAFGLETIPDSVLINGEGAYACADAVPARPVDCIQRDTTSSHALIMNASRQNVLRVVNVGAYAGFSIALPGARLTPIRVDGGHSVRGLASRSVGFMHPGERIDLIVELDSAHDVTESQLIIALDDQPFKYQNPALTVSHKFPVSWKGAADGSTSPGGAAVYEFGDAQALQSIGNHRAMLPPQADRTIVLYSVTQKLASLENEPHGFINHTMWKPQSPALINLGRELWNEHQFLPRIDYNHESPLWVDIVLNNLDEDWHPFHLHGYDFWVLSKYTSDYNWGSYNPFGDESPPGGAYNLVNPIKKDTVYVPRRGYVVLRIRADNPGLWMFHCHVMWHQASGMAMAFDVR